MNKTILNTEIQNFINNNLNKNIQELVLKGISFEGVSTTELVEQIEAKKRCNKKLPTWFETSKIYYPNKLNIEQTSSETTARYKSELISGKSLIDLTGGFGVDTLYFSKQFNHVVHCELNPELSNLAAYNFQKLNALNIETIANDGLEYLRNSSQVFDWIYIDPSRRHDTKGKVFFLNDCLPNVPEHLDVLLDRSPNLLVKTSPLLDISVGLNELKHVKTIHIVAVDNDVKELLWHLKKDFLGDLEIKTANIKKERIEVFNFLWSSEKSIKSNFNKPLKFLYEPNAAILKAGAFNSVSSQFGVSKLHKHSHLYTSNQLVDFSGRRFQIEKTLPYNKKEIKSLGVKNANITTRNFPETVEQIRKKFKISDGGDTYLFFTTQSLNDKIVLLARKLD